MIYIEGVLAGSDTTAGLISWIGGLTTALARGEREHPHRRSYLVPELAEIGPPRYDSIPSAGLMGYAMNRTSLVRIPVAKRWATTPAVIVALTCFVFWWIDAELRWRRISRRDRAKAPPGAVLGKLQWLP